MKQSSLFAFALLSTVLIPAVQQIHAASQTIDGIVSDTMCGKKHMIAGKTDAECIQECMKSKVSYALVAGTKVYTLAGKPQSIASFAGKHVRVEGELNGNTLTLTSIHGM